MLTHTPLLCSWIVPNLLCFFSCFSQSKRKADREAELQRMRDQAKDEQERARRKALEEQLAWERENAVVEPVKDTGLLSELERLGKVESYQKKEIARLQAEVDSAGKTSELKLAIMQKK